MKKIIITLILILNFNFSYAENINNSEEINNETISINKIDKSDIFKFFSSYYSSEVKESYKYIKVNFKDVIKWSELEDSLQKLIYLNLIENPKRNLEKNSPVSAWGFYRLSEKILEIKIIDKETKKELLNRGTNINDLKIVWDFIWEKTISIKTKSTKKEIKQKKAIFSDIYNTITNAHYDKDILDEWEILDSAIEWITKWTNDKHTVYFPPIESSSFQDWLSSEYEWIWSYVEMQKPWVLIITSPIPWSPSEKAWLKWWDHVLKVDSKEITKSNPLKEVITWIKWPAWSKVLLTINRNWKELKIEVIREKIILTDIESELLNYNTYYIQIKSFWDSVSSDFKKSLEELQSNKNVKKIIIDLRNNGWWYLSEVTEMLSYFVEKNKKTAVVKYYNSERNYLSRWYELIDFNKYDIVILQNSWTASASEILIWTLKDYYPKVKLIWENTYWKWSVQVLKNYNDWSLLKYTVAKWFTWWTETWIDWVWIKPTTEIEFNIEKYKKDWTDNQLNKAINIR